MSLLKSHTCSWPIPHSRNTFKLSMCRVRKRQEPLAEAVGFLESAVESINRHA
jgi:hypothetical protein